MTETPATSSRTYKPRAEDIASPDALIAALYGIISGPAGTRNWSRLRTLFLEGARLVAAGRRIHREGGFQAMSVDEWIEDVGGFLEENDFYEREIVRHSDRFGNIIQAFSTYEARNQPDGPPIARGINAIQLVHADKRWWIAGILWDNESRDNPIPGEFTPYLW
ncbi:MAG: hypothetical protein P8Y54_03750 [Xanthomonadales bacterium]